MSATASVPLKGPNQGLPDTGETLPEVAVPTIILFFVTLAVWGLSVWGTLSHTLPLWLTIPVNAAVSFVMFTVLHDAAHHAIGKSDGINEVFGRLSMLFVVGAASFGLFRFIHIEHHRNTNEGPGVDPDAWASGGPVWQHPLRWLTIDLWYLAYYLKHARHRPLAEMVETFCLATLAIAGLVWAWQAGVLWTVTVIYLIPQRIAVFILAWWFDWLPHHGLTDTARENRFRATRNRVSMEWLFTPMMLSQNYHLVHHLYPVIPFYRYLPVWRRNEEAFLARDPALSDVWGQPLSTDKYRQWRGLPSSAAPAASAGNDATARATFYPLKVAEVKRITSDSVAITFDVPEHLRDKFRFQQGQHLTIKCDLGGQGIRRNYSICSTAAAPSVIPADAASVIPAEPASVIPAQAGIQSSAFHLRIGVKLIPGGAFSTHAFEKLKRGDTLEVLPPSGRFFTQLDARHSKFYVAISAGSGITPILSILGTTLETELESKFILLFGNRTADSIMFRDEIQALKDKYPERFQVLHFLSRAPEDADNLNGSLKREEFYGRFDRELLRGRLDRHKLGTLLSTFVKPEDVDEWFLCGPQQLAEDARRTLIERGVDAKHVHQELFIAAPTRKPGTGVAAVGAVISAISIKAGGKPTSFELAQGGETVLDAAMRLRTDLP
ncbi:MAG: fatty acid desaturase, partial [Nevskiales bacterium]